MPEQPPLLLPTRRQRPLELLQHERLIGPAPQNHLHDVGREQGQPKDPAHVALRDVLGVADLADLSRDAEDPAALRPTPTQARR
jgi:hypothetical protein